MLKNGSKQKLFLMKKSESLKLFYPKLNSKSNSKNKNIYSSNNNPKNSRKKLNRIASAFMERNFNTFNKKLIQEKKLFNASMLQENQLIAFLFKLRQYHNELSTYNKSQNQKIMQMIHALEKEKEKLRTIKELKNIDLPDEKIGIKDYNSPRISKKEMEKNLFSLIKQQKNIDDLMSNEEEYNKTLEYMLESEQNQLFSIKKQSLDIIEKIENLKRYQKIVDENITKNKQKDLDYNILKNKIFNDIKLVQKINSSQNLSSKKLNNEIILKEIEIQNLEDKIKEIKEYDKVNMEISKKDLKEKVKNAIKFEQNRIQTEKKYIDIINSFYLIQKYFLEDDINDDNFDKDKLIQTKEFQQLLMINKDDKTISKNENKIYLKEDNSNSHKKNYNKNQMNSIFSTTFRSKKFFDLNNKNVSQENITISATFRNRKRFKEYKGFKNLGNKTSSTFYQTGYDFNTSSFYDNNSLNDLIMKCNYINFSKEDISNFISNLQSKLDFYGKQMNLLHDKEVKLEYMKRRNNAQVKNIISKNYFNFEEITKNNIKFKEYLKKNDYFVNKMKNENKKIKIEKILKKIEQSDEMTKYENNENKNYDINDIDDTEVNIDGDNILFTISKDLILNIKKFFLTCSDYLKDIYITLSDNQTLDSDTIENNTNEKNPFLKVLKKLYEYDKNEDIIISDDYRLLLQYLKKLVKYCKENEDILTQEMIDDINSNLIEKFYMPGEVNKKLDKVFINRFMAKRNPNFNNIFNHFILLPDQVIDNIKAINDLIIQEEKKLNLRKVENYINLFNNNSQTRNQNNDNIENSENYITFMKNKKYKKIHSSLVSSINSNTTNNVSKNKFEELSEDKEDIEKINLSGIKVKKTIEKKWRVKSLDKKITDKLYKPFLDKNLYLRQINSNIPAIKQMTSRTCKAKHQLKKRIGEVDANYHHFNIYNNPNINVNKLCDRTYNSLVELINNNTKKNNIRTRKFEYFFDK